MVYKNIFNRFFFSIFFFGIYFFALSSKYLLVVFGTFVYLLVLYEIIRFFNKFLFKTILLYLLLSYFFFNLYFFISYDFLIFNIFVFTIILFDSFSYFAGKIFGKNHIFKFISPKKTLEGYLGGVFFTNISMVSYFFFMNVEIKFILVFILVNLTIFFSILGDLIESYFKRKNNIKDSSSYLPGHGGFFDRFDSFIASIIMLTIFNLL
jgi:phosphatidate cytidylyltransferase